MAPTDVLEPQDVKTDYTALKDPAQLKTPTVSTVAKQDEHHKMRAVEFHGKVRNRLIHFECFWFFCLLPVVLEIWMSPVVFFFTMTFTVHDCCICRDGLTFVHFWNINFKVEWRFGISNFHLIEFFWCAAEGYESCRKTQTHDYRSGKSFKSEFISLFSS